MRLLFETGVDLLVMWRFDFDPRFMRLPGDSFIVDFVRSLFLVVCRSVFLIVVDRMLADDRLMMPVSGLRLLVRICVRIWLTVDIVMTLFMCGNVMNAGSRVGFLIGLDRGIAVVHRCLPARQSRFWLVGRVTAGRFD